MTHLNRATTDQVEVRSTRINGGELAHKQAPGRAPAWFYQGRKVSAATAARLLQA